MSTATVCETPRVKAWFTRHQRQWEACSACPLCKTATQKVFYRGTLPAKVLFIGEAPGNTEDTFGVPFIGKAGKTLDAIILEAFPKGVSYGITNVVACRPLLPGNKLRKPNEEEIDACFDRLTQIFTIAKPKVSILLGAVAKDAVQPDVPFIAVYHPAYINRAGGIGSKYFQETVSKIKEFLDGQKTTLGV